MKSKRILFNLAGAALAAVIMAAGFLVPRKLLADKERSFLEGEWSEVSIGADAGQTPAPAPDEEGEKTRLERLLRMLTEPSEQKLHSDPPDSSGAGIVRLRAEEQLWELVSCGALSGDSPLMMLITDPHLYAEDIHVYGDAPEYEEMWAGRVSANEPEAGQAEAEKVGAVSAFLTAGSKSDGYVIVFIDSQTGKIIRIQFRTRKGTAASGHDAYMTLWGFARYLGLDMNSGFTGSVEDDEVRMDLGRIRLMTRVRSLENWSELVIAAEYAGR